MKPADIASLLAPFLGGEPLNPAQLAQVSTYLDLLLKWNARINLTAVRRPEEIVTRHFGESLFTACHLCPRPGPALSRGPEPEVSPGSGGELSEGRDFSRAGRHSAASGALAPGSSLVDLGSGAGFPGLPIKIYAPVLAVTLIESNHKKATFLREVIRALTLTNIDVFDARAETFPGSAPIVTLRAVEKPQRALVAAARLVSPGGRLALLLGASQLPCLLPGFSWGSPINLPGSTGRILCVGLRD